MKTNIKNDMAIFIASHKKVERCQILARFAKVADSETVYVIIGQLLSELKIKQTYPKREGLNISGTFYKSTNRMKKRQLDLFT